MTNRQQDTTRVKRTHYARPVRPGAMLKAEVSPCVVMYPSYPLQIKIALHGPDGTHLGDAYAVDRSKTASTYADADVERLLEGVRIGHCPRCSAPAFDPATVETSRSGLCEACFIRNLELESLAELQHEQRERADEDRRMKRNGMAVRVTAWVHPSYGDDYQVDWYLSNIPMPEQVRMRLRDHGSSRFDDYEIVVL
jgi:hypothetical protein